MQLHSPDTYSLQAYPDMPDYPSLDRNLEVEVLVIGTGISGALTAWALQEAGFACTLIDRRRAARGSTAASTSLLQYELDCPLTELRKLVGQPVADESYRLCYTAIGRLEEIAHRVGADDLFQRRNSLQWASSAAHLPGLRAECAARKALGFDVTMLDAVALRSDYGMQKAGGLLSTQAAQIDAYALTHRLLQVVVKNGGAVYEETEAAHIDWEEEGVSVRTSTGRRIAARRLVIACGYESQRYLPKAVEQLYATYVLLTEPLASDAFWNNRDLLWETARPYLYLRGSTDDRVLIGGRDERWNGRPGFPKLPQKTAELEAELRALMPGLQFQPALSWAGIFAGTHDSLPYIGAVPGQPHTAYALGFGGNGILFSVLAADAISALFRDRTTDAARLFSFNRA